MFYMTQCFFKTFTPFNVLFQSAIYHFKEQGPISQSFSKLIKFRSSWHLINLIDRSWTASSFFIVSTGTSTAPSGKTPFILVVMRRTHPAPPCMKGSKIRMSQTSSITNQADVFLCRRSLKWDTAASSPSKLRSFIAQTIN